MLQFFELAQELGVEFAFPTRTLHVDATPSSGLGVQDTRAGASGAARRGPIGLVEAPRKPGDG